jgi:hypothetical protein
MADEPYKQSEIKPPEATAEFRASDIASSGRPAETARTELPGLRPRITSTLQVINEMQEARVIGRYAIGGAIGATFYLEPVATMDIDIFLGMYASENSRIISPHVIYDYLQNRGFVAIGESIKIHDWLVQFLPVTGPLVEEAIARAREETVATTKTFVFTAEHLVAIALETGRPKDKARILQFLESGTLEAPVLEDIIVRHGLSERWSRFKRQFFNYT